MDVSVVLIRFFVNTVPVLAALYIWMGIRAAHQDKTEGRFWYSLLLFDSAAFTLEYYFEMQIDHTSIELVLRSFSFALLAFLPAFGILFLRGFVKRESAPPRLAAALFSVACGIALLYVLNPLHGLFYGEMTYRFIGGYSILYMKKGPFFYLLYAYYGVFLLYGLRKVYGARQAAIMRSDRRRMTMLIIYIASLVPGVLWLVLGLDRIFDPTPIYFVYIGSISLWGEGRYDLMRTQLKRWENMFEDCSEPAFLFGDGDEWLAANKAAGMLLDTKATDPSVLAGSLEAAISCRGPVGFPAGNPSRWLDVRKSVFDAYRGLIHYQLTDVTDRRKQHQLLRASEEQYRLLITQMQQGLAVFEAAKDQEPEEYLCLHGNEAFAKSVGMQNAALLPGKRMGDVLPVMDEEWKAAICHAANGEDVPRFEQYWQEKQRYFGIRVYLPLPGQVAVILSDITARKAIEQELGTKDKLLVTIIGLTQDLLGVREYRQIIPKALGMVGEALDVSHGYLFENCYEDGQLRYASRQVDWCAADTSLTFDDSRMKIVNRSNADFFLPALLEGKAYSSHICNLPDCESKTVLIKMGIQSMLVLPVFAGELLWGYVGFDECRLKREWTVMEQSVLRLFADSLGRAVERYDNEQKLRSAQERNTAMLHAIPDLFFIITPEGRITHCHASMRTDEPAVPMEQFLNKLVTEAFPLETGKPMLERVKDALRFNAMQVFEYSLDFSGRVKHFEGRVLPINRESVLLLARDITERKQRLEKIEYLSYHDQLTGLYNRRRYRQQIAWLDKPENLPLAIVMADLNGLKLTNDAFGHQMGDVLLTKTADVLLRLCDTESVFHMGGDEFVLLLPNTDESAAEELCRRIHKEVAGESTGMLVFSISIGYAVKRHDRESLREVFRQAEDDMYRHKLTEGVEMRRRAVQQILETLYQRSPREMEHSKSVGELSEKIAKALQLAPEMVSWAAQTGVLHDIGKIGIDQAILEKEMRLNEGELREIRRHSEVGYRLLNSVHSMAHFAPLVLEHHERWDGTGYPKGIAGDRISLIARIVAVADGYDAMVSPRTYKQVMTKAEALDEIYRCAGQQYDPQIARVFVEKVMCEKWGLRESGKEDSFMQTG